MTFGDLPAVQALDAAAFDPIWQQSQEMLEAAFRQAAIATVAEGSDGLVGYQISTAGVGGGHLARLAIHPRAQRRGIGYALVHDLLTQFVRRGTLQVTVNTQDDNLASLALYKKAGFHPTGESYPIFQVHLD
jgi:ribosomal protein S18 acetylase RimI-like enzyme